MFKLHPSLQWSKRTVFIVWIYLICTSRNDLKKNFLSKYFLVSRCSDKLFQWHQNLIHILCCFAAQTLFIYFFSKFLVSGSLHQSFLRRLHQAWVTQNLTPNSLLPLTTKKFFTSKVFNSKFKARLRNLIGLALKHTI